MAILSLDVNSLGTFLLGHASISQHAYRHPGYWPEGRGIRTPAIRYWQGLLLLCLTLVLTSATPQPDKLLESMQIRYGDDGVLIMRAWQEMLADTRPIPVDEQLEAVNGFFNRRLQFTDDILLWKQKDYWATPLESMGVRAGDCEDFVIAKYISLLQLGVPVEQLRLIYVRARLPGTTHVQAHMVLGYYATPEAVPLILDNLLPEILPATERADLTPVFSFNSEGLWIGNSQSSTSPTNRLSRWRDVIQRMQMEGLVP